MISEDISLRRFLGTTAAGVAGLAAHARMANSADPPSERVRLGLIGCGGRGTGNLLLMMDQGTECVAVADIEDGHRSTSACQLANIAWRTGRRIRWDAGKEEILGGAEASQYLAREYREPWTLPKL